MPIYEYECSDCGQRLERLQRLNDPPPEDCECGGKMRRLVSAPAFQFKGTGWYVTDYGGRKSGADADGSDSKASNRSDTGEKSASDAPGEKAAGKTGAGEGKAAKKESSSKAGKGGDSA